MNSSHKPQIASFFRLFGLGALLCVPAFGAFSPESEAVLEELRDRISAGLAGQESYDAWMDWIMEGGTEGCEARSDLPAADGMESRWNEIRSALAAVCPEPSRSPAEPDAGNLQDTQAGRPPERAPEGRLAVSQTVRPARSPPGTDPAPLIRVEGSRGGLSGRLSLRDYRPDLRSLEAGTRRFSLFAGHLQASLEETRLGFVAGSRFFAGWSGRSGMEGILSSPQAALDGLGLRARAGKWTLEAAGTWNRLERGTQADSTRRDAQLLLAGLDRRGRGLDFRFQAARQRFEPSQGAPTEVAVAGAALANRGERSLRWRMGAAASLAHTPAPGAASDFVQALGGYAEASLASPQGGGETWRLEARQADADWANPLQSPRGYLRDTLDRQWILSGRGEGGFSARSRFPIAEVRAYRALLQGNGAAAWSLERGILAGESGLAVIQELGEWAHEIGATGAYRRSGLAAAGSEPAGWGQSLSWKRGLWLAKIAGSLKGDAYSGSRPAPLSLAIGRQGSAPWTAEIVTGNIRNPLGYLRVDVRQGWNLERRVKVEQTLRLPWSREGMSGDMGYQLRLAAML